MKQREIKLNWFEQLKTKKKVKPQEDRIKGIT